MLVPRTGVGSVLDTSTSFDVSCSVTSEVNYIRQAPSEFYIFVCFRDSRIQAEGCAEFKLQVLAGKKCEKGLTSEQRLYN